MKKIISLMLWVVATTNIFSQQTSFPTQLPANNYLSKSSDQLIIGGVLLGAGTGLIFAGNNTQKHATGFDFTGSGIMALGILVAGGSIPLLIAAAVNHKKGKQLALTLKVEKFRSIQQLTFTGHSFPALAVKVNL